MPTENHPMPAAARPWRRSARTAAGLAGQRAFSARARALGLLAVLATLGVTGLGSPDARAQAAGADWSQPSGTLQATRFSGLNQIHAGNVGGLVEEFSYATGNRASHQGQPLVVGSRMYVVKPFPNQLVALDLAHPGVTLWTYSPSVNEFARGVACCDVVNRGAVYADGKVIYNVLDGTTVAVNATTGQQVWRTKLADPTNGETLTGAPLVVKDKVIVGNAGGELGVRGWVQGLDLKTGKPLWKAFNTGPDADVKIGSSFRAFYAKDRGTNLGATTWPGTLWQQGGSTAWAWFSYDPGLNLLYYGTGNPGVWNPDMRPGDNKWGASIFARNPDTGQAVWAYQLTPHDGWDYDAVNESIVVDLALDGVTRKALVHFNKNGFAYTFDRATGQVLRADKFGQVTWADRVDLGTGAPQVKPGMSPHEGQITSGICPSPLGAKDFEPASYSPQTGLFYVPAIRLCDNLEPLRALYIAGTPFMGADLSFAPVDAQGMGELLAWDAARGQAAWSVKEPLPLYAGTLVTAGNVVFYGTLDRHFKAVDASTGRLLMDKTLECGILGNPITYLGPDGKQRVAVYTGVGWLAGGFAGGPCPGGGGGDASQSPVGQAAAAIGQRQGAAARANAAAAVTANAAAAAPTSGMLHVFKLP